MSATEKMADAVLETLKKKEEEEEDRTQQAKLGDELLNKRTRGEK